jgi:hypothetical protein
VYKEEPIMRWKLRWKYVWGGDFGGLQKTKSKIVVGAKHTWTVLNNLWFNRFDFFRH